MKHNFTANDFVWAKLQKYPPWPALILEPGPNTPKKPTKFKNDHLHWVYFFGTHNYSWIEERHVKDYKEYKDKFVALYKTTSFKESVEEINQHIEKTEKDPNYRVKVKELVTKPLINSRKRLRIELKNLNIENNSAVISQISKKSKTRDDLKLGIIGVGSIGSKIIISLIKSGYRVNIWNRTSRRYKLLQMELGTDADNAKCCKSPRSVLLQSDIIFMCVSDYNISKSIIQNSFGINDANDDIINGKSLIEMGGVGSESSKDMKDLIESKGGRYLEVQIQEGDPEVSGNKMLLLTAGDNQLFIDCQRFFKAFSFRAIYLGDVGYASKLRLILQMMRGVIMAGLSEGLGLAERCGLNQTDLVQILEQSTLNCGYVTQKANKILQKSFTVCSDQNLQYLQNDMKLGLEVSDETRQPMMMAATATQVFKHCLKLGYGGHDPSSIFMRTRH